MADGAWWNSSSSSRPEQQRFDNATPSSSSSSSSGQNQVGSFGWSCTDSGGSVAFPEANGSHGMMDLALNTPSMDWNQSTLFRGDHGHVKGGDADFRSMIQETTSSDLSFDMESAMYGSPTAILQAGLFGTAEISRNHQSSHGHSAAANMVEQRYSNYQYGGNGNYGVMMNSSTSDQQQQLLQSSPLMFRASSPKQHAPPSHSGSHLQFSNNAPFWNPSAAALKDVRSSFSPALLIDEKPKNLPEFISAVNKSGMGSEPSTKKTRNETPSPLPAFKVRKEKMGDRITALQQLVSPFGKTDTASVLSEAIEYIKILHEQVNVLSGPYMKSGATNIQQHHRNIDHTIEDQEEEHDEEQDLRRRGLCLVPVASTYPIAHDPTLDFWAPPFGGSYR